MKLFNNETENICATEFWTHHQKRKYVIPVPSEDEDNPDSPADLNAVDGVYHLYRYRVMDNQLNWRDGGNIAVRDDDEQPVDTNDCYYERVTTVVIEGLEHDGVSITKNATVNIINERN